MSILGLNLVIHSRYTTPKGKPCSLHESFAFALFLSNTLQGVQGLFRLLVDSLCKEVQVVHYEDRRPHLLIYTRPQLRRQGRQEGCPSKVCHLSPSSRSHLSHVRCSTHSERTFLLRMRLSRAVVDAGWFLFPSRLALHPTGLWIYSCAKGPAACYLSATDDVLWQLLAPIFLWRRSTNLIHSI